MDAISIAIGLEAHYQHHLNKWRYGGKSNHLACAYGLSRAEYMHWMLALQW